MKTYPYFFLFLSFILLLSCHDTNGIYDEIPVNSTVNAPAVSGQFKKRVLIEDYTGTWCGNCTRVSWAIELAMKEYLLAGPSFPNDSIKAVPVGIHSGNDPYNFTEIEPLKNLVSPNSFGLPISRLNRTIVWTYPETSYIQEVKNLLSNNCGLGLAMNSNVANGIISLNVKVKFAQNFTNLKLVVYVLENKLLYKQENYTTYYGNVNPVLNFTHNHVLRKSLTELLGNSLTGTTFNETVSTNFSVSIPTNVTNPVNMYFVAFVVDQNNLVVNVRAAKQNEDQVFEQNP